MQRKMRCLQREPRWRPKKWRKLRRLLLRAKMRPREAHSQLTAAIKEILKVHHISVQRYWNATLVGPDVRRFLTAYVAILEALAAKISGSKGAAAAAEFTATHSRVLEQLQVVSHFMTLHAYD
jgi:hypothetical protein